MKKEHPCWLKSPLAQLDYQRFFWSSKSKFQTWHVTDHRMLRSWPLLHTYIIYDRWYMHKAGTNDRQIIADIVYTEIVCGQLSFWNDLKWHIQIMIKYRRTTNFSEDEIRMLMNLALMPGFGWKVINFTLTYSDLPVWYIRFWLWD